MGNFLRSRHPANTPFHVSARTGIPPATVENWLLSRSGPDREHLSILLCCYGPAFLRAVLPAPPEWVNRAYEQAVEDDLRAVIARAESDLARLRSLK
jgi:hypothetical protein